MRNGKRAFLKALLHTEIYEASAEVLKQNNTKSPADGMDLAVATVRGLFLAVSHRENIGAWYPQILDTLVEGACQRLFSKP